MIVDFMRIPTDEYGNLVYSIDEIKDIFEQYQEIFPEHQVIAMPDRIKIWEDLDLDVLKSMRQCLDEIITSKEIEENGL